MNDADKCPRCGRENGDHTMREMRACHPTSDLNLPFEAMSEPQWTTIESAKAGGLVVLSGVMDTEFGKFPVLVFRFAHANGIDFFPDMTLVLDETAMRNTAALVNKSVSAAIKATKA